MVKTTLRTHSCGELTKKDVDKEVTLSGWVQSRRDHGGIIFIDLRDRYGLTQVVFDPSAKEAHSLAEHTGREWVLQVAGKVRFRGKDLTNPNMPTGEIEVIIHSLKVLSQSQTPPIEIDDKKLAGEDARLKWRFLDLRRPEMQRNLKIRHKAMLATMKYLDSQNFLHVTTPMLVKSTPEGARDYVVPSRVNPGKFYALPQSPQLYKQLLQVSGVDRYFQFAICLRDEDLRADRQPEHVQIDLEMSFVTPDDIFTVVEGLMKAIWKETLDYDVKTPFQRIKFNDSMNKYGSDKPDLRYELQLIDASEIAKKSDFSVFKSVVDKDGAVKCLVVPGGAEWSRKEIDRITDLAQRHHAKGLAWMKYENNKLDSSIVKFFKEDLQKELIQTTNAKDGDLLLFIADEWRIACESLGQIRIYVAEKLNIIPKDVFKFAWVTEYPLFEWNKQEKKWDSMHHMFCMPKDEHIPLLDTHPGKVHCTQYDLTLNGVELCSGSIRINRPDIQKKVLQVIGMKEEELENKFGFLMEAFRYGAPPHGGVGLGLDRIVGLLVGTMDIREVIAFPKNKAAQCPMDGCPSDISEQQFKELNIKSTARK